MPYIDSVPRASQSRHQGLITPEEIAAMLEHAAPHLRRYIALRVMHGVRGVAVLNLTWDRVELPPEFSTFDGETGIDWQDPDAAGSKRRDPVLPVSFHMLGPLRRWRWADANVSRHVVHYRGKPVTSIKKAWQRARERAGLREALQPRDIRHTLATILQASKNSHVPARQVNLWLGHASREGTSANYFHLPAGYLAEAHDALLPFVEKIDELFPFDRL